MFYLDPSKASKDKAKEFPDEELFIMSLGQPSLFEELLERYQASFFRRALSVVKNKDEAEDVVQDAFVRLYRHGSSFVSKGPGSFKSWAYRVLINVALTEYQKKKKHAGSTPEEIEFFQDMDEIRRRKLFEDRNYIVSILCRMPSRLASVLRRFFLEGMSQEEIAKEDSISVGAVKVRIYRAKESFREIADQLS